MSLVLITDADVEFCTRAREAIGGVCGDSVEDVRTVEDAAALASLRSPDLLVMGPSVDAAEALAFAESVLQTHPSCVTVVVARKVTTELMRVAMRVGVRDVVPASATSEVTESLRAAAEAAAKAVEPSASAQEHPAVGRVVTFFSTKGGVGKSFIASNVAVALAETGAKTVLLDLDLQFGDAGVLLDLTPQRTIYDAVQCFDRLDTDMLEGFLTEHKSGVKVLLAPVHPEDAEAVTVSRLGVILSLLREMADFVVVDTAAAFNDILLAAIDASDMLCAVVALDVLSIKNTRISLQKLGQLGYDPGLVKLVVNRADSKVWLEIGEVEERVEAKAIAKIPSDRLVPRSVNRGVPVVLDAPRSPVARALTDLAKKVKADKNEVGNDVP